MVHHRAGPQDAPWGCALMVGPLASEAMVFFGIIGIGLILFMLALG